MRRRQICNMHGGYRGRGVTINWGTTRPQSSEPIIQPLPEPYPDPIKPLEPPPLPNVPIKPVPPHSLVSVTSKSHPNIAGIVGLTLGGVGALTAIGVAADKYMKSRRSGIANEDYPALNLSPDTDWDDSTMTDDGDTEYEDDPEPSSEEEKYPQSKEEKYPQRGVWNPNDEDEMNRLWEEEVRLAKEHDERSKIKKKEYRDITEREEQERYSKSLRRSNIRLGDRNDPVEFHYY